MAILTLYIHVYTMTNRTLHYQHLISMLTRAMMQQARHMANHQPTANDNEQITYITQLINYSL